MKTITEAKKESQRLIKAVEEKFSRYCSGDFSDFAAAHEILEPIIGAGCYLPEKWPEARPSLSEYMMLMDVLLAFVQREPKSSLIYNRVDGGYWNTDPCFYPCHPLQENRVIGYWFRKLLDEIIKTETKDGILSPEGLAVVGPCLSLLT